MTHSISAKAQVAKDAAKKKYSKVKPKSPPPKVSCKHPYLVPLEVRFAKKLKPNGPKFESYYDFNSNIMGAQVSRVDTYYCPACKTEIPAPRRKK